MLLRTPRLPRTDTRFPFTTLFRSLRCAALAFAEARFTGADVVVATLVSPLGNRQGGLHVTRAARVDSLLLQTGALGRVESLAPVAWAASAAGDEVDFADEAPISLVTISKSTNAPSLIIHIGISTSWVRWGHVL